MRLLIWKCKYLLCSVDVSCGQGESRATGIVANYATPQKSKASIAGNDSKAGESQKSPSGTRATDSARIARFTKELSGPTVVLGTSLSYFLRFF